MITLLQCNDMMGNFGSWHSCGYYFYTLQPPNIFVVDSSNAELCAPKSKNTIWLQIPIQPSMIMLCNVVMDRVHPTRTKYFTTPAPNGENRVVTLEATLPSWWFYVVAALFISQ